MSQRCTATVKRAVSFVVKNDHQIVNGVSYSVASRSPLSIDVWLLCIISNPSTSLINGGLPSAFSRTSRKYNVRLCRGGDVWQGTGETLLVLASVKALPPHNDVSIFNLWTGHLMTLRRRRCNWLVATEDGPSTMPITHCDTSLMAVIKKLWKNHLIAPFAKKVRVNIQQNESYNSYGRATFPQRNGRKVKFSPSMKTVQRGISLKTILLTPDYCGRSHNLFLIPWGQRPFQLSKTPLR